MDCLGLTCQLFRPEGVNGQALAFPTPTGVVVEVDEYIAAAIGAWGVGRPQVKLPG